MPPKKKGTGQSKKARAGGPPASVPPAVQKQVRGFEAAVNQLESTLAPVLGRKHKDVLEALSPSDSAKLALGIAQATNAVYGMLVMTSGAPLSCDKHFSKEQARLDVYESKVAKATSALELKHSRPSTTLNIEAANRFITAAIPELTAEQKAALKDATAKASEQARQSAQGGTKRAAASNVKQTPKAAANAFLDDLWANPGAGDVDSKATAAKKAKR